MKILVNDSDLEAIEAVIDTKDAEGLKDRWGHFRGRNGGRKGRARIEVSSFSDDSLKALYDFLDEKAKGGDRASAISRGQVKQWQEVKANPGGQTVTRLEAVEAAMREYIGTSDNRYLFEQCEDGNMLPWFVSAITYHPADPRGYSPPHVTITLLSYKDGGKSRGSGGGDKISISSEDFRGKTMGEILEEKGYYLETPARMVSYDEEVEKWLKYRYEDGFQMSVTGKAVTVSSWYGRDQYRPVGHDGEPAKMVVDPDGKENEESSVECKLWNGGDEDDDGEHEAEQPKLWRLPFHPVIRMFDLSEHTHYSVHINNMEPYVYDKDVGSKLVLPEDVKMFVETLIEHSGEVFEDIVAGKSGGTIVLIEGQPGIGKTLTAEVYAEVMERPLYKVQSSQLGTSPKALEDELGTVLGRAERWGAILLIDEADVYIYERGGNIEQNAIVGVFLRVLEYYRGVLFMTTNRGTVVDDAIVSRLTARLTYEMPCREDQRRLWRILSAQNGVTLDDTELAKILDLLPACSGRDIKNLLKLSVVMARKRGGQVTADILKFVSRFRQARKEEVAK